jgi:formylglycine-generating enzyme required for sulfatase activity
MVEVIWDGMMAYCDWLTERDRGAGSLPPGYEYRLPTEAEWEYACRAGTTTRFFWGDELGSKDPCRSEHLLAYAVYCTSRTESVGSKLPNPWGLYDMLGNVNEVCSDWKSPSLPGGRVTDPTGPATGTRRVVRGGCFFYLEISIGDVLVYDFRSACRIQSNPMTGGSNVNGFRVALGPVL